MTALATSQLAQPDPGTTEPDRDAFEDGDSFRPRGAPRPTISEAVDLFCTRHQVDGRTAYGLLVQAARDARLSVSDTAAIIVASPETL